MFSLPPEVQNRLTAFGLVYRTNQYAPGNEHDLQVPWMFAFPGDPAGGRRSWPRCDRCSAAPGGLPGNDDLGSLSAWYIWNAMGIGPVTPGAPFYVIGSPAFDRVTTDAFTIVRSGRGPVVVSSALGGQPLRRPWLTDAELRAGETLRLEMSAGPSPPWATTYAASPPTVSTAPLGAFGCRRSGSCAGPNSSASLR